MPDDEGSIERSGGRREIGGRNREFEEIGVGRSVWALTGKRMASVPEVTVDSRQRWVAATEIAARQNS